MEQKLSEKIYLYSDYLKQKYGRKVFRVGLSLGKECPHRKKNGGCIFCNPTTFTGDYQSGSLSIAEQLEEAIPRIKKTCGDVSLLAYFQDETSTAGNIEFLRQKYSEALEHPEIIGLIVSTRPDYINHEIVDLLKSFSVPVTIEIGLQSIHNKSLDFLNRGHNYEDFKKAVKICGEADLTIGVHLIMGIPGESFQDMKATIDSISRSKFIKQVKFHNLVVYRDTKLADMLVVKNLKFLMIKEYIEILAKLLPFLRKDIVITRLFTSNVRQSGITLLNFEGNKTKWMNSFRMYLYEHNIEQGQLFQEQ